MNGANDPQRLRSGRVRRSGLAVGILVVTGWGVAGTGWAMEEAEVRPVLEGYCFKCHSERKAEGGISFGEFGGALDVWRSRKEWVRVRDAIDGGRMPPEEAKELPAGVRAGLSEWIGRTLADVDVSRLPVDPGHVVPRRLNRTEYGYTVSDLFGIGSVASGTLPEDQVSEGGFDNEAATLAVQPLVIEKFLDAADAVVREVWGDRAALERLVFERPPGGGELAGKDFEMGEGDRWNEMEAARRVLGRFLGMAFRREVGEEEVERYEALFRGARASGDDYLTAMKLPVRAALVSPAFLFRTEAVQTGGPAYRVSGRELANRLSYFLWMSLPDERLAELGARGSLADGAVLEAEVVRMLRDPRSQRMSRHFGMQWLRIGGLGQKIRPDRALYPNADDALLEAMKEESVLFVDSVFREDLPLRTLLDADYTFANERLAAHYGMPGVAGEEMRRVRFDGGGTGRGGVLTQASVLTVTSSPRRSSPVFRGKWILDVVLGQPPPPPPPNVPELGAAAEKGVGSLRDALGAHRADAACASCHDRIDPLGFALEAFDATGRLREGLVDNAGVLPDGSAFEGHDGLKVLLRTKREGEFVRHFASRLLVFALGRELSFTDERALQTILTRVREAGGSSQALVREIVSSYPFQYSKQPETPEGKQTR